MTKVPHRDVLVVDDDETTRSLFETLFSRSGLTVVTADNGESAMALLDSYEVGAIVLDLLMPRCDGASFLVHLAMSRPDLIPRVVICSAAGPRVFADVASVGVWAALEKPVNIGDLTNTVLNCLAAEPASQKQRFASASA
jgi:DNA-binding NtrC family response regulator